MTFKSLFRTTFIGVLAASSLAVSLAAQAEVLYRADWDDRSIWLLGTIHMVADEETTLSETSKQAIGDSDHVWLELAPAELEAAGPLFMQAAARQGDTLESQLSEETWEDVVELGAEFGLQEQQLNNFQAWFLQVTFVVQTMMREGLDPTNGIDMQVMKITHDANTDIRGLETAQRQLDALKQAQGEAGEQEIIETMFEEIDLAKQQVVDMEQYWQDGNLDALMDMITEYMAPEMVEELLEKRNQEWVKILSEEATSGTHFVAVGAGHLGGDQGLIKLLEQQGATVEKVDRGTE